LGDCRRIDFKCPHCNFVDTMSRAPTNSAADQMLLKMDRVVTLDQFHYESERGADTNRLNLARIQRWGDENGIPVMFAKCATELEHMNKDHRQLSWYWASRSFMDLHYNTHKRERGSVRNYYDRMQGTEDFLETQFPTNTPAMTHRFGGLEQRLGSESKKAKTFSTGLLVELLKLMDSDYERARGSFRSEMLIVITAVLVFFHGGFRANEPLFLSGKHMRDCMVLDAGLRGLPAHFIVVCPQQTKENRVSETKVPICYDTADGCPLRAGYWVSQALDMVRWAGREEDDFFFLLPTGERLVSTYLWSTHLYPKLAQLQREGLIGAQTDIFEFNFNSFRRTWTTMGHAEPDSVPALLLDAHARWRLKERENIPMNQLYANPSLKEKLRATHYLSPIDE
jgi:hypothetical protein